jgi:hypothetical protein
MKNCDTRSETREDRSIDVEFAAVRGLDGTGVRAGEVTA